MKVIGYSRTYTVFRQVPAVADGPARRAASRASCCTQRWTLSVTNCLANIDRRLSHFLVRPTTVTSLLHWASIFCQTKAIDVHCRNFLNSKFRITFQRKVPLFWRYPNVLHSFISPQNVIAKKQNKDMTPKCITAQYKIGWGKPSMPKSAWSVYPFRYNTCLWEDTDAVVA